MLFLFLHWFNTQMSNIFFYSSHMLAGTHCICACSNGTVRKQYKGLVELPSSSAVLMKLTSRWRSRIKLHRLAPLSHGRLAQWSRKSAGKCAYMSFAHIGNASKRWALTAMWTHARYCMYCSRYENAYSSTVVWTTTYDRSPDAWGMKRDKTFRNPADGFIHF